MAGASKALPYRHFANADAVLVALYHRELDLVADRVTAAVRTSGRGDAVLRAAIGAAPGALRDYRAIVEPWPFAVRSVTQPVTIWSPTADEIVPPRLLDHLARQLPHVETITVIGAHDWITQNWPTVLRRAAPP